MLVLAWQPKKVFWKDFESKLQKSFLENFEFSLAVCFCYVVIFKGSPFGWFNSINPIIPHYHKIVKCKLTLPVPIPDEEKKLR